MSGHSKWSSIKHKKGAADAKRGQLFTKLTRALIVAAKDGGPDPASNLSLQNAIDKARAASMPKDNIERAIARGAGTGADAATYEHISYEGYGPGGVAVYVDVLTDNRNRTAGEVRHTFARADGNLAESGAVAWLFERKGVILVDAGTVDEDELMLAAADAGADDVTEEGSSFEVICAAEDLHSVREALEAAGIAVTDAEVTMLPKTTVAIHDEATAKKVLKLIDSLEENDDVQDVYANFDIPEQVLEAVAV
jgi:YebC/PmpR family DNA-binding regulatory protein